MTTPLHSTLKRALTIDGRDYMVTLTETMLKIALKGKRNGVEPTVKAPAAKRVPRRR